MFDNLFNHHDDKSKTTCIVHDLSENAQSSLVGSMTFFELNRILAGSCAAFAIVIVLGHMFYHATHLSVPREQLKIMRVALLIPLYALIAFLGICFPKAFVYLYPWYDMIEANALVAYFLLLCEYVSPHHDERADYFSTVEISDKKARKKGVDGATWFKQRWCLVFQYPIVAVICAIATDVTEAAGVFCQYQTSIHFAKLWIGIVRDVSQFFAILSVFLVALTLKPNMPHNKPVRKLISLKLVVTLAFFQGILFWILHDTGAMKPNDKLTYADVKIGIPNLASCIEMVPISLVMAWSFPVAPYKYSANASPEIAGPEAPKHVPSSYQGGVLGYRAFLAMFDPSDAIKGTWRAVKMFNGGYSYPQQHSGY